MALSRAQSAGVLHNLGWRVDTSGRYVQAVRDFQTGWNLGAALSIDGAVGPNTSAALLRSEANRRAGRGTASAHFSFSELACKCGGRYTSCRRCWIIRAQLQSLEVYRSKIGSLSVISGCRCPGHNAAVGGASSSQHMFGTATDVAKHFSPQTVRTWHTFAGIGYGRNSNEVCHVDRRDRSSHNPTGGSQSNPTSWVYSQW